MKKAPLGSKLEFLTWLAGFKPDSVVGKSNHCHECPLGNYLSQKLGEIATIERNYYYVGDKRYRLPKWAREFVHYVDHCARDARDVWSPVTAETAYSLCRDWASLAEEEVTMR